MIRIRKGPAPDILENVGRERARSVCDRYDSDQENYLNGLAKLPKADSSVYGHPSVKDALKTCQNNKCCYSEAAFVGDYGDVEHFRPKGRVQEDASYVYPGYYWLAYDWENLVVSKELVNRSFKKSHFPLADPSVRARCHRDDISEENPLIVDPTKEDPRAHVRFHEDEAVPHNQSTKGKITIDILNLNHSILAEARRRRLKIIKSVRDAIISVESAGQGDDHHLIAQLKATLNEFADPASEFSSMAIDFLRRNRLL